MTTSLSKLHASFLTHVRNRLGHGEQILWYGVPDPALAPPPSMVGVYVFIVLMWLCACPIVHTASMEFTYVGATTYAYGMIASLICASYTAIVLRMSRYRTTTLEILYVLTNRHCIVVDHDGGRLSLYVDTLDTLEPDSVCVLDGCSVAYPRDSFRRGPAQPVFEHIHNAEQVVNHMRSLIAQKHQIV